MARSIRPTEVGAGREAEGVLQSLLSPRAWRGVRAPRATFRVLAEGDPDPDLDLDLDLDPATLLPRSAARRRRGR